MKPIWSLLQIRAVVYYVTFGISTMLLQAQDFSRMQLTATIDNTPLPLAFAGGLRAPQFSSIDFNLDGIQDLFVFDRSGNVILPFLKTGAPGNLSYTYAPEYTAQFPRLEGWAFIRDYNKDGIPDIFSASTVFPGCAELWRGIRKPDGTLGFRRVTFNYGIPDILQYPSGGIFVNIYVSPIDLPAVEDVDGDGDIDILSFEPDGSFAFYFRNLSKEEGLGPDSVKYRREDLCWGKFAENQFNEDITLSTNPNICAQGLLPGGNAGARHSGSTLCLYDDDGDADMDLLIGDIASSKIKKLQNGGTQTNAFITSVEKDFPVADVPADIDLFLAAYVVDADGDGLRDLIVCPNDAGSGETQDHIWLYINKGTASAASFKLETKNFLVRDMLFFNSGSHPAFADVNADGLQDIIVGTNGMILKNGIRKNRMVLLQNTGTSTVPAYSLIDEDYLAFSSLGDNTGRLAPTTGDLDSDGDTDLLVGDAFGQLFYFENTAGVGQPFSFAPPKYPYGSIFIGQNAKPCITDVTEDGLNDMIIGEKNNQLNLFVNRGSKGSPLFIANPSTPPNTTKLGNFFSGNDFYTQNGAPLIIPAEQSKLLLFGTEADAFFAYSGFESQLYGTFTKEAHPVGNIHEGRKIVASAADIDSDGYLELAVGNDRGGIAFYNTPYKSIISSTLDTPAAPPVRYWPNPSTGRLYIEEFNGNVLRLLSLTGQTVRQLTQGWNDLSDLPAGIYMIHHKGAVLELREKLILLPDK